MRFLTFLTLAVPPFLAACAPMATPSRPVTIPFAAEFGGKPFACGQSYHLGTPPVVTAPSDLRFYVTSVELLRADGSAALVTLTDDGVWQGQGLALLDFEDGTGPCASGGSPGTNTAVRGTAPAGDYTGLRFQLGVPEAVDHQDATVAAAPLNVTAMFWNWQAGYKFLKADFPVRSASNDAAAGGDGGSGFALHLGSTECASASPTQPGTSCKNPNRPTITLTGFDPLRGQVVIDLAPVLARVDLRYNTPHTVPGCMSGPDDPECLRVMPPMGVPVAGLPAEPQRIFSARAVAATPR
jgi:uncharacterized repeat protein (TIGR04052 family)